MLAPVGIAELLPAPRFSPHRREQAQACCWVSPPAGSCGGDSKGLISWVFSLLPGPCLSDAFLAECERADRQTDRQTTTACLSPVHWLLGTVAIQPSAQALALHVPNLLQKVARKLQSGCVAFFATHLIFFFQCCGIA